jgi:hypothetical protein
MEVALMEVALMEGVDSYDEMAVLTSEVQICICKSSVYHSPSL